MEELLEITTWSQLSIHAKPVMLFNMKGYFEHLLKFIEHSIEGNCRECLLFVVKIFVAF